MSMRVCMCVCVRVRVCVCVPSMQLPRITPSGTDNRPVVDGVLLPDMPRALLAGGAMKRRRVMTGVVTEEWTRHIGMFLEDLFDNVPGLGKYTMVLLGTDYQADSNHTANVFLS